MKTKLTVLVDNTGFNGLDGEWGLSVLCQHEGKTILCDAGQTDLFAKNMELLGFDINDVEYATLSHAHYDHGGGMETFFKKNSKAKFFIRDGFERGCYYKRLFVSRYIGLDTTVFSRFSDRIVTVSGEGNYALFGGAYLVPHKTEGLEKIGKREHMYLKTRGGWTPDSFRHEQSLVLDTDQGLVIINSCSHGGAENIINEVRACFPDKRVCALIGGLHLYRRTDKEVREIAKQIKNTGIGYVLTGHCTKDRAYKILEEELGDTLHALHVGLTVEF